MAAKGASAAANASANNVSIAGIKAAPWQRADKSSIPDVSSLLSVGLLINGRWWLMGVPQEPANPSPQTAAGSIAIGYQPLFWQQQPVGRSSAPSSGCIISASPSAGRRGHSTASQLPAGASPDPAGAFTTCTCWC